MKRDTKPQRQSDPTFGHLLWPLFVVSGLFLLILAACQPAPEEVTADAIAEETLSETDRDDSEVTVAEAGPAAWSCRQYLELSNDTGAHFDLEASEEAEEYFESYLRALREEAAEAQREASWPSLPIRSQARSLCQGQEDVLLSEIAIQLGAEEESERS